MASAALAAAPAAASETASAALRDPSLSLGDRARAIPKTTGSPVSQPELVAAGTAPAATTTTTTAAQTRGAGRATDALHLRRHARARRHEAAAFLAKGEALLVVSAGDTLDNNTYRVDILNPNEIVMTYLPMNIQQTLRVPGGTK